MLIAEIIIVVWNIREWSHAVFPNLLCKSIMLMYELKDAIPV